MSDSPTRVYCAGPLFNEKEREEMAQLAEALELAGYETFLPQRDGLELTKCVDWLVEQGHPLTQAGQWMSEAIFALDVFQVLHGCDAVVANLNGRVPDEGTVSEVSMAWARGKVVVGYKADSRSAFGGQDNPLVAGLFQFSLCTTVEDVVGVLGRELRRAKAHRGLEGVREREICAHIDLGNTIWGILQRGGGIEQLVHAIVERVGDRSRAAS